MTDPFAIIAARQQTHGNFASTAWMAQRLRDTFRHDLGWERLSIVQREVADSSAIKWARILSGDPNCEDHWVDLIGYAELALIEIRERQKAAAP